MTHIPTQSLSAPDQDFNQDFNDENSNTSANNAFAAVMRTRLSRRTVLSSSLAGAAMCLGSSIQAQSKAAAQAMPTPTASSAAAVANRLGFAPVAKSLADAVHVPKGYSAQVLYALGDPLAADVGAYRNDGSDGDFDRRAGDHHDGMEYFGLDSVGRPAAASSNRALLVINHEATTDQKLSSFFLHSQGGSASLPRPAAEVDKELLIHGLSVVEIRKNAARKGAQQLWSTVPSSTFNRRITPLSPALIHGPARASPDLVTRFDSSGVRARGSINNCGTGKTPWGTLLSGEENWYGYFYRDSEDDARRSDKAQVVALKRYGRKAGEASRHGWESVQATPADGRYARWNNSAVGDSAKDDYRNEMNTFGYMIELDPYDGRQVIRKRSALGRFSHENAVFAPPVAGQALVAYMGDDARGEYLYRFVSRAKWDPADAHASNRMAVGDKYLDQGTLYAARFNDDGSGEWLALTLDNPKIAQFDGFPFVSVADIAIYTRLAADAAGATKMDRPEWGAVHPHTGEVYFTLTKNNRRTQSTLDAANPRAYVDYKGDKKQEGNVNGHIIRMGSVSTTSLPDDARFRWDIYLFAAEAAADAERINLSRLTDDNDFSSPDGLAFSPSTGICWIQTDDDAYTDTTNCMMLAALAGTVGDGRSQTLQYGNKSVNTHIGQTPDSATLKRFLVGPKGAEITGICESPDGRALFVNIQHPGENTAMIDIANPEKYESHWPANAGYGLGQRPRSATIVITRDDGAVVGT